MKQRRHLGGIARKGVVIAWGVAGLRQNIRCHADAKVMNRELGQRPSHWSSGCGRGRQTQMPRPTYPSSLSGEGRLAMHGGDAAHLSRSIRSKSCCINGVAREKWRLLPAEMAFAAMPAMVTLTKTFHGDAHEVVMGERVSRAGGQQMQGRRSPWTHVPCSSQRAPQRPPSRNWSSQRSPACRVLAVGRQWHQLKPFQSTHLPRPIHWEPCVAHADSHSGID